MTDEEIKDYIDIASRNMSGCTGIIGNSFQIIKEYIDRLESENAELKDQWDNLRCVYSYNGDVMEYCVNGPCPHDRAVARVREENDELKERLSQANEECLKWHERAQNLIKENGGSIFGYEKTIKELQSENAALRERLEKAAELPYERKRLLWGDKDRETLLCPDCLTDLMGGIGDETFVVQCPNCGCFVNCMIEPIPFTEATEARLAELKGEEKDD